MEQFISELLAKYPVAVNVYLGLTGVYMIFCAVASFTKTDADDKIADKIKRFFSLPVKK